MLLITCNQENRSTTKNTKMPVSSKTTLISVEQNINISDWAITHQDLALQTEAKWSVEQKELHGGKQDGVRLISVDNGGLKFVVVPTRGMSIYQVQHGGITLGWDSPVKEFVHPQYVHEADKGGLGWLDGYNEWMVRCGMEFAGHPGMDGERFLTLHGKIANIPASEVEVVIDEDPPYRIRIRGRVDERWFNGPQLELWTEISTVPGSNSFRIDDVLTNRAQKDQEFMVIYHANFGPPLLEAGSQLHGVVEKVVPFDEFAADDVDNWNTYGEPKLNYPERVYCIYPSADGEGNCHFLFRNSAGDKGVSFTYSRDEIPYFTQWKNEDINGYVTGLEPSTGFPHNRSVERKYGRVPVLKPGESRNFGLEYTIHNDKESVEAGIERIGDLLDREIQVVSQVINK